uniref:C4-dicarboxylate transporter/malic acid transport protein n=1 Tax=Leersia perrieri TaxID=77586 RepID=A0A0D9WEI1_9ORYZ
MRKPFHGHLHHRHGLSSAAADDDMPAFSLILTRFDAGYFRISLSLCGQALLLRTLCDSGDGDVPPPRALCATSVLLWSLALLSLVALTALYATRCFLRFAAVRAEFRHRVAVNYLFAPWASWLLLLQSEPPSLAAAPRRVLWCAFTAPVVALDVTVYGQWLTEGREALSMAANPTGHVTVVANLVAARAAAAELGWREGAVVVFAVAIAHYAVLFVTLYQRLQLGADDATLPGVLRPVFFLFFAAPSMASLAWGAISSSFDIACKMLFFLSLFLFASLATRSALFRRAMRPFSVAWWAFPFPLTMLAVTAIEYAREVGGHAAVVLEIVLSALSAVVTVAIVVCTAVRTSDLLPHGDDDPLAGTSSMVVPQLMNSKADITPDD